MLELRERLKLIGFCCHVFLLLFELISEMSCVVFRIGLKYFEGVSESPYCTVPFTPLFFAAVCIVIFTLFYYDLPAMIFVLKRLTVVFSIPTSFIIETNVLNS